MKEEITVVLKYELLTVNKQIIGSVPLPLLFMVGAVEQRLYSGIIAIVILLLLTLFESTDFVIFWFIHYQSERNDYFFT